MWQLFKLFDENPHFFYPFIHIYRERGKGECENGENF